MDKRYYCKKGKIMKFRNFDVSKVLVVEEKSKEKFTETIERVLEDFEVVDIQYSTQFCLWSALILVKNIK
jgi:hypothetical protein